MSPNTPPSAYGLVSVARRILKEDCRLLIVGDGNVDIETTNRFVDFFCKEINPDVFVGRMVRATMGSGNGIYSDTSGPGVYTTPTASGTIIYNGGTSGNLLKTISDFVVTGTVATNTRIITAILNTGVQYKGGNWYSNHDVYIRPVYFQMTGVLSNGNPILFPFLKIAGFSEAGISTPLTPVSLYPTGGAVITGFDFYGRDITRNSIEMRLTTSTGNITGNLFSYYGTLFYRAASGSPTNTVAGLQVDSLGSELTIEQYTNNAFINTGHLKDYLKATRNPNCFMFLLGQNDVYNTGWMPKVSGLLNIFKGLSAINGITDPKFLVVTPWTTYAGSGKFEGIQRDLLTLSRNSSGNIGYINLSKELGRQRNISEHDYFDANEVNSSVTPGYGIHLSATGYNFAAQIISRLLSDAVATGVVRRTKSAASGTNYNQFYTKTHNNPVLGNSLGYVINNTRDIQTNVQDYSPQYHDWVLLTTGNGYPNPDPTGGGSTSNLIDINGQAYNYTRTTNESFEITAGRGDTSTGSGWLGPRHKGYFSQRR